MIQHKTSEKKYKNSRKIKFKLNIKQMCKRQQLNHTNYKMKQEVFSTYHVITVAIKMFLRFEDKLYPYSIHILHYKKFIKT